MDIDSLISDYSEHDTVLDLNSIERVENKKRPRFNLHSIRANAPALQLIARLSLPLMSILYFSTSAAPPLLVPLFIVILACLLFLFFHLYLYRQTTNLGFSKKIMISANQLDITTAHLAWLLDPATPAPMMLLIIIAVIGNGIQHGFTTFRALLQSTALIAPLVIIIRTQVNGFHSLPLIFLFLCTFFLIYAYFLFHRIDAIQSEAENRFTRLELDNYKLKQLGMALQKGEVRYRNIFDNSSAAMVLIEDNMRISLVNAKFLELTKYSKSELYNKKRLSDLIYKDDLKRIQRFHAKRKKMGGTTPTEYECKMVDKDTNIKHVIIRLKITQWHERMMATIEDITSRKQAKSALLRSIKKLRQAASRLTQSQKRYQNLFENTGTATILVEKNMRISMANSKFCELTGFSKNKITGKKRLSEFIERKNLYRIRRFHAKQKKRGLPLPTEYECLLIDNGRDLKHVVMKIYSPQEQESSIVSFFDITKHKQAEAALQDAHERLRIVSVIDELTQVANRRQFNEKLNNEWNRLKREGLPLSLIMCDVDYFKSYNDTYGHQNGDRCLRSIADAISNTVKRSVDVVARYGGEEFAIIMPNTDMHGAFEIAESVRAAIEQLQIPNKASSVAPFITLSLGVSSMIPPQSLSPESLIKDADNALYEAKRSGRNQVRMINTNKLRFGENRLEK
ncbi:MAG: diguanylate cyclase [Desulfobacteraceae bacterium]|nr:diguanylate cyclase [Desulfobacteraceae bacterium]